MTNRRQIKILGMEGKVAGHSSILHGNDNMAVGGCDANLKQLFDARNLLPYTSNTIERNLARKKFRIQTKSDENKT